MFRNTLFLGLFLLAACSHKYAPHIDEARNVGVTTNPFYDALRNGYIELADEQWSLGNKRLADVYGKKALLLANDMLPKPETLADKEIDPEDMDYMTNAKAFVNSVIGERLQYRSPLSVAKLQLMFDCWANQHEKTSGADRCKKEYEEEALRIQKLRDKNLNVVGNDRSISPDSGAVSAEEGSDKARKKNLRMPLEGVILSEGMPEPYEVFFKTNSTFLDESSVNLLEKVMRDIRRFKPRKILISGNTDRSGSLHYNRELAMKRSEVVGKYLVAHGMPLEILDLRSYDASAAWINQEPNDNDEYYRSVKIIFLKDGSIYYQ